MEGYCAVACLGLADGREADEITGAWLVWYDPAGNNGNGDAAWSHDPADAARFTEREWAELYTAIPGNRPQRPGREAQPADRDVQPGDCSRRPGRAAVDSPGSGGRRAAAIDD